jgi:hypothetical protein
MVFPTDCPCGGHRVSISRFTLPDSFLAEPRASVLVSIFCASGLVFGGTESVGSRFYVLRSRTHFRRYRGCRIPFSCFAHPDSFLAVPRASGLIFMFCAPGLNSAVSNASGPVFMFWASGLVFGDIEGVRSRFHVFSSQTCFRRYRGCWISFSSFARPDLFSAVPSVSGPVFTF